MLFYSSFFADIGFYIADYSNNPSYPRAFVKRSVISSEIEGLIETRKLMDLVSLLIV